MKRHSRAEISVALGQAQEMMRRGQSQAAICRALEISVMTLHRWRKEHDVAPFLSRDETLPTRNQNEVQVESLLLVVCTGSCWYWIGEAGQARL
jgi:hypothetical protein